VHFHDSSSMRREWAPDIFARIPQAPRLRICGPFCLNCEQSAPEPCARTDRLSVRQSGVAAGGSRRHETEWANGKGVSLANQAHGSRANLIDLYAAVDIHETEGLSKHRRSASHEVRLVAAQ